MKQAPTRAPGILKTAGRNDGTLEGAPVKSSIKTYGRVLALAAAAFFAAAVPRLHAQEPNIVFGESKEKEQQAEQPQEESQSKAETQEKQTDPPAQAGPESTEPEIQPRFELHIPSVSTLFAKAGRSNSRFILDTLEGMVFEMGRASAEGIDVDKAAKLLGQIGKWPDTKVDAAVFAPDLLGRARWIARLDWPVEDLHRRVQSILESDAARTLLQGVTMHPRDAGGYEITLLGSPLAFLTPGAQDRSYIASHDDLRIAANPFTGTRETAGDDPPLLVSRLNLTATEKDTGAGLLSKIHFLTAVEYAGRVDKNGNWNETLHVHWPLMTGLGAKAAFGKVKESFFVPGKAMAAFAFQPFDASAMLDGMAGFGPQMMMGASGEFQMAGEAKPGPIAKRGGASACFTILPGTGFLPVPDIVAQLHLDDPEAFIEETRQAAQRINKLHREREQPEPWTEKEVAGRPVFWNDKPGAYPGMVMPFVMRPVIFTTSERDLRDHQKDILVVAWVSTSPERFVQRWIDLPRNTDRHDVPASTKTYGQGWINWKTAYAWLHPYVNVALSATVRDTLLPRTSEIAEQLTDAMVTLQTQYTGLNVRHHGPIPTGPLALPIMLAVANEEDESGGSDLARERLASRRLKTFYHHCKLFEKDYGRWPAELAELDGYIDFQGHPELLELNVSTQKRWSDFLLKFGGDEKDEDADTEIDEEDVLVDIDDDLFVIDWGKNEWRLGIAPGTLDHIKALYIDQDGVIHRAEKEQPQTQDAQPAEQEEL